MLVTAPAIDYFHMHALYDNSTEDKSLLSMYCKGTQYDSGKCMKCSAPVEKAVLWAQGKALAWFCKEHYDEWMAQGSEREIVAEKDIAKGEDPRAWAVSVLDPEDEEEPETDEEETTSSSAKPLGDKAADGPSEDGSDVEACVCPECSKSVPHKKGSPCIDRTCPECGAPMIGQSKKETFSLWKALGHVLFDGRKDKSCTTKDADIVSSVLGGQGSKKEDEVNRFYTFKDVNGRWRWVGISSTAILDRERDILTRNALDKDAQRVLKDGEDRGALTFWHEDTVELGRCDFAVFDGVCLIESGLWGDDEIAQRARTRMAKDSSGWGLSVEFLPTSRPHLRQVVGGEQVRMIFDDVEIVKRSLLPLDWAANAFTMFSTRETNMNEDKQKALEDLVGPDMAASVVSAANDVNTKAATESVVYKDVPAGDLAVQLERIAAAVGGDAAESLLGAVTTLKSLVAPRDPLVELGELAKGLADQDSAARILELVGMLTKNTEPDPAPVQETAPVVETVPVVEDKAVGSAVNFEQLAAQYEARLAALEAAKKSSDGEASRQVRAMVRPSGAAGNVDEALEPRKDKSVSKPDAILDGLAGGIFGSLTSGGQ